MKIIDLIVLKSDILKTVAKTTDYTGKKTESANENAFHSRVATETNDEELLNDFWRDSCAHLAEALRVFITEDQFGKETLKLTLEVSGSYDEALTPAVENGVLSFLSADITARWFDITYPEKAGEWKTEAGRQLRCLTRNLYHRVKPKRGNKN